MARKRYIKPGFFKNEDLAELPPLVRILFTGLWCFADREGRLEDRPMRLKSDIIPYDNLNVDKALDRLQSKNFIIRYKITKGKEVFKYIQILSFKKHQDVHVNEQTSTIPAPVLHGANTVQVSDEAPTNTPLNLELNTLRTLNLEEVVVLSAREKIFDEAVTDYFEERDKNSNASFPDLAHIPDEKEKNSAQKEKVYPSHEQAMAKVSETAHWRNIVEHNGVTEAERTEWFKIFYERNEDRYRIVYPNTTEMASHYYFWTNTYKNREVLQTLNQNATIKSSVHAAGSTKANRAAANQECDDIAKRSREFLQQFDGIDAT